MNDVDIPQTISDIKSDVIRIGFYDHEHNMISSGSGFLCTGKLVTNNHVFFGPNGGKMPHGTKVAIETSQGETIVNEDYDIFLNTYIECGSSADNKDYFVFDIPGTDKGYNFDLGDHDYVKIGDQVLILGFPFMTEHFTAHVGYVSSKYTNDNNVNIIQLDANTNNGNSGGPVVEPTSQKVVGIMTRKESGLDYQFDNLLQVLDELRSIFETRQGSARVNGVDPLAALAETQKQMRVIGDNIKRSATTGIGYAFSCNFLKNENFYVEET